MKNILIILSLLWLPTTAAAAEVPVHRITEGERIEQLLNQAKSRATAEFKGAGTTMELMYSSPAPLHVLILLLDNNKEFNPLESLVVTLPAGVRQVANVSLSKSPAWHPGNRAYRLHFLSTTNEGASFEEIEFTGDSIGPALLAGIRQLTGPLPYTPSSYHRVASYKVWAVPIIPVIGGATMILMLVLGYFVNFRSALYAAVLVVFITQLRFAGDSLFYSISHAHKWLDGNVYETAGSLPAIGEALQELQSEGVYLCTSGTSYARRVLAYHAYPVEVVTANPSHVVVHASGDWSYELGQLRCGSHTFRARITEEYSDGSVLYTVTK